MKLLIGLCSKCLYHFVANLLTKHPHKILCKSVEFYGRYDKKYFGAFFMTHSVYIYIYSFIHLSSSKRRLTVMNFHLILSSAVLLTFIHTGPYLPLNTTRSPYCRHFFFFVSCS